jgi:hypothetical protein
MELKIVPVIEDADLAEVLNRRGPHSGQRQSLDLGAD